jgi:hypothetical protein
MPPKIDLEAEKELDVNAPLPEAPAPQPIAEPLSGEDAAEAEYIHALVVKANSLEKSGNTKEANRIRNKLRTLIHSEDDVDGGSSINPSSVHTELKENDLVQMEDGRLKVYRDGELQDITLAELRVYVGESL